MDGIIEEKIRENASVKTNYKSDLDGKMHYIRGYLVGQTERFFKIEGGRYHDLVPIPKKNIISMFFLEPKDILRIPHHIFVTKNIYKKIQKQEA